MCDTRVTLCGTKLKNPLIAASGTFGYGYEFAEIYDINCLGSISLKGTTLKPRFGNESPRIAECPGGLLNSVGLQNPGVREVIHTEIPKLKRVYWGRVMANVCGFSIEEYIEVARKFDSVDEVGWLELNISCPNVHGGGMSFGTDPHMAAQVTREVKKVVTKPLIVKLSPNVSDIVSIARACEDAGADGLTLINTLLGMRIDLKTRKPILKNKTGGLSGPAVLPIALRMIYEVYEAVKVPIVGAGGVQEPLDVLEMMMAGATAVEVGSSNLVNPWACRDIIAALPDDMEKYGIKKLSDIIGAAH